MGLIAHDLRPQEQGFYYTFWSVIGLYVFCELGLDFVITQFTSHEMAHLQWTAQGTLSGPEPAKGRVAALLGRALVWYGGAAALVLGVLLPGGLYFFSHTYVQNPAAAAVWWRIPWIMLAAFTVLNLAASPLFAILEGCGRIAEIAVVRTGQNMAASAAVWLVLARGGGLLAVAAFQAAYFATGCVWLLRRYGRFFGDLLAIAPQRYSGHASALSWRTEVWPFQWRIALSSISNYLVFQLFNPVLFATHGPVAAARMGMSLSLCNSLLTAAMTWMTTKAAPFGAWAAARRWADLDRSFFRTFRQSAAVLMAAGVLLWLGVALVRARYPRLAERVLDPGSFAVLLLAMVLNHAVFCQAQYLRAHKQEPFFALLLGAGLLSVLLAAALARPFGAAGMAVGYLGCSLLTLIAGTRIFLKKRQVWHA